MGAGALPGRSEAVGSGTNQEKHDPEVGTRRAQTPLPTPPPDTRERHGPPPHSDNPRRHSLPSPWADIPALEPPWARWPSLPGKSHKEMPPPRDFHMVNTSPPNTRDSPHPGKKWLQGGPPSGESGILEPLREKTIQKCSVSFQMLQGRHPPPVREMGEGQRHLFRGASETAFSLEREPAKTDLS